MHKSAVSLSSGNQGFALIITISLMVLLALLAVGMLSLSAVTLRSSSNAVAVSEARANARLALSIALGELQKSMGPDQRVSASGSILGGTGGDSSMANPRWTGVWESWKAEDNEAVGGYSRHQSIQGGNMGEMHPTYTDGREDHFQSWLVSLPPESADTLSSASDMAIEGDDLPGEDSMGVRLVGEGSVAGGGRAVEAGDFVNAALVDAESGRFAWWVGDESQKARLSDDSWETKEPESDADRIFRHQAPGATGSRTVAGLEGLADDTQLASLPSLLTLDVLDGAADQPSRAYHDLTPFSFGVLADVREGGLKRDLSVLLERPIPQSASAVGRESGDDYMLYKFNTKDSWSSGSHPQEAVPIHDLAAYYQLYDGYRSDWKQGVRYNSNLLSSGMQVSTPDFGDRNGDPKYLDQYTTMYRQPVMVKIQFLLSMFAEPITPRPRPTRLNPTPDTHELVAGITPSVTLWNPTNLPMVMRFGDPLTDSQMMRMQNLPLHIRWNKNDGEFISDKRNLMWLATGFSGGKTHIWNLYFSGKREIKFEPGEVKVFSLPWSGDISNLKYSQEWNGGNWGGGQFRRQFFFKTDRYFEGHEVVSGWEPQSFMLYQQSASGSSEHVQNNRLKFRRGDTISFEVTTDNTNVAGGLTGSGSWIGYTFKQSNYQDYSTGAWFQNNYMTTARNGNRNDMLGFNSRMISKGLSIAGNSIVGEPRSGSNIIARSNNQDGWPFLQFSFMAGTETGEAANGGSAGGRKFAGRPFLHSTVISPQMLDDERGEDLYNYGWNWWLEEINDIFEAPVQVSPDNQGYFGGGYTPESGTTHVVQQEIPVTPPISIASLSHAHLGGFSLARGTNVDGRFPSSQILSAHGQAGLFPHTLQAIGNSYAHPNIPADRAYVNWSREFQNNSPRNVTMADHSYLANKALWDEYFFSSIGPERRSVKVFDSSQDQSAEERAREFFFGEDYQPLPNRRMTPYLTGFDEDRFDDLFDSADDWRDGLADKIAAQLMVEGPFNVNSTSVEAWKVVLSSLKGKPVAYLDPEDAMNGGRLSEETPDGVPVSGFTLPNGQPVQGSPGNPADPEQWTSWRELTDDEIEELAEAMVEQVKLRGPFLSLSEFVNRRLDGSNSELSLKGALQAALDDPDVSINEGFRDAARQMGSSEIQQVNAAFDDALEGPAGYGSAAYVDQADVLRNLAGQLTPRGDTFVIRTYGDSVDAAGNVLARAWCEAVVQRLPEYLDSADEAHVAAAELSSEQNKTFGRKMSLVSFRWLSPSEV